MSEIQAVIPQSDELTIAGEVIKIEAAKVGKLPQILQVIQPIAHLITNVKHDEKLDLSGLFMLYASDALALTAILADKPRTWVDSLNVDDALVLFTRLFEVNLDFFIDRVLPLVVDAMKKFANVVSQSQTKINGLSTSALSSVPDTATTTS